MNRAEIFRKMQEVSDAYSFHIRQYIGWMRLEKGSPVDLENIKKYFSKVNGNPDYAVNTKHIMRQAVKAGVRLVYQSKSLDDRMRMEQGLKDLDHDVPPPKINSCQITKNMYLTGEEMQELKEKARSRKQVAFIIFLFTTACRVGEMIGIKIGHCMPENDEVKIRILGKGKKERYVHVSESLFDFVKETFKGEEYLFETEGGKSYHRCYVSNQIKKLGRHVLKKNISAHTLRHSGIKAWLETFPNAAYAIAKYCGFSSIATFFSMYGNDEMTKEMRLNHEL